MPRAVYEERLASRHRERDAADARHRRLATYRLLLALATAALAWFAFAKQQIPAVILFVAPLAFAALVWRQSEAAKARRFAERTAHHYERGLDRLNHRWMGKGEAGNRFRNAQHPYSDDLDLFGAGSLFELLSTARTRAGEAQLASWLMVPADREELLRRQEAVEELRPRIDLREDLAALGEEFRTGVFPEELSAWGSAARIPFARWLQPAALALAILAGVLLIALFASESHGAGVRVAIVVVGALEALLALPLRPRVLRVTDAVEQPAHDLDLLSQVLARLERERFHSPKLAALRRTFDVAGKPASARIAALSRLVDLLHSRDNLLVRIFGPLVLWTTQVAFAIERWRAVSGPAVAQLLQAAGEIEALCALAGYAYEHPSDPFPEIADGPARIEGEQLGHPLLSDTECVRNDVSLAPGRNLVVISGSNMSGKSTYLRAVGVNAVLALAGAPVRARSLQISTLRIGASITVSDSLQGGTSRFYAEITRLGKIVSLAREGPALFLLDELLNGTNSHDRGIGASGVVRELLSHNAIGLVTTHDLALTAMGEQNQHFEDHFEAGAITFDYRIRPGVVEKSNALALMRAIGLEV